MPEADVVLVQVGGGGLVSGISTAVKGMNPDVRVVAVEPERSPALHESLKAGEPVTVEAKSIADGLNGPYAGGNCVTVCTELGRRVGARHRGGARGGVPLHVRPDEARLRGCRSGNGGGAHVRGS